MAASVVNQDKSPQNTDEDEEELRDSEKWWRDHYELLESRGYRLRPRYRPGWIPSWRHTGKNPLFYEDHIPSITDYVMDATRIADRTIVSIKRISKRSKELSIALFLSPEESPRDAMNHCIPIFDHFSDASIPQFTFLVMPLLRWFDDPPFFAVDEVIDFIRQTLEGLLYMHSRGVAHRDCAALNIMLDASSMYPHGFHPVASLKYPSGRKLAPVRRRRDVQGIKYYFIDFGISTRFEDDVKGDDRVVTGIDGQDRDVPELSAHLPYNPFAVDVFILGNVYRKKFLDKYSNLAFLTDLVASMTAALPDDRPSADKALTHFNNLVANQASFRLRWRLKQKDAGFARRIFEDIGSVAREGVYVSRSIITLPMMLLRN